MSLNAPQRTMLDTARVHFGHVYPLGRQLNTARALARRGLLERRGHETEHYVITPKGRSVLEATA